jgi:hypothetical protein
VVGDVGTDVSGTTSAAVYTVHRQFAGNRNWVLTHFVVGDGEPERILPQVRAIVAANGSGACRVPTRTMAVRRPRDKASPLRLS